MSASMTIDQAGLPAGVANRARTDGLATGALVTLTSVGGGVTSRFALLWVPPADTTAVSSLLEVSPGVWTFSPDVNVYGSYRIELIVDEGLPTESRQIRIFGIRTPNASLLIPAANERADSTATLPNFGSGAIQRSENNEPFTPFPTGSGWGWWKALADVIDEVDSLAGGGGGGVSSVTASPPLYSSGGANPNIIYTPYIASHAAGALVWDPTTRFLFVTAVAATTVQLPSPAAVAGQALEIRDVSGNFSTYNCVVSPPGGANLYGDKSGSPVASITLDRNFTTSRFVSDGAAWFYIGIESDLIWRWNQVDLSQFSNNPLPSPSVAAGASNVNSQLVAAATASATLKALRMSADEIVNGASIWWINDLVPFGPMRFRFGATIPSPGMAAASGESFNVGIVYGGEDPNFGISDVVQFADDGLGNLVCRRIVSMGNQVDAVNAVLMNEIIPGGYAYRAETELKAIRDDTAYAGPPGVPTGLATVRQAMFIPPPSNQPQGDSGVLVFNSGFLPPGPAFATSACNRVGIIIGGAWTNAISGPQFTDLFDFEITQS